MIKKLVLSALVFIAFLVPACKAGEAHYEFSLDLQVYKSCKVTFNYPYTNNHSISEITTVGRSLYKHEGSANHLTFIAEDIDIYSFTVTLRYENQSMLNQTKNVLIGLWSGTEAMDSYIVASASEVFIIHVRLSLTEQPSYPTPEEVSQAVVHKIEQDLVEQTEKVTGLVNRVETLQYMIIVAIAAVITVSLCAAVAVLVMWRKMKGTA